MKDYKVCPLLCIFQDRKIYNHIHTYQKNLRRRIDSPTPHSKLQIVNRMYCNTQPITFYSILHSITAHKEEYHNVLLTVFEGSYVSW